MAETGTQYSPLIGQMVAGADDTLKQNCGITNTDYYNYLNGTDVSCSRFSILELQTNHREV